MGRGVSPPWYMVPSWHSGANAELQRKVTVLSALLQGQYWGQWYTGGCPSCTVEVVDENGGVFQSRAPLSSKLTGRCSYPNPRRTQIRSVTCWESLLLTDFPGCLGDSFRWLQCRHLKQVMRVLLHEKS